MQSGQKPELELTKNLQPKLTEQEKQTEDMSQSKKRRLTGKQKAAAAFAETVGRISAHVAEGQQESIQSFRPDLWRAARPNRPTRKSQNENMKRSL